MKDVQTEKAELVGIYQGKARDCVFAIDADKIKKSSALQLATASGILLDKSLLLAGEPTANLNIAVLWEVVDAIRAKRDEESKRQFREARARMGLPPWEDTPALPATTETPQDKKR